MVAQKNKLEPAARRIKLFLLDVDGVMTDGGIYLYRGGEAKKFNVHDGLGISLLKRAGISVGIITGRVSEAVRKRAEELKLDPVYQGYGDKLPALEKILKDYTAEELAYTGDDLLDIPVLKRVGLSFAPANARPEVQKIVDYCSTSSGGAGAIRDIADWLLKMRGVKQEIFGKYIDL